jgi:hypothetical protein
MRWPFGYSPQGSLRSSLDYGCHLVSASGLASLAGGPIQSAMLAPLATEHVRLASLAGGPIGLSTHSARSARRRAYSIRLARSARLRLCTARRRDRRPVQPIQIAPLSRIVRRIWKG